MNKAIVLLSGGQDSVTCLGVALKREGLGCYDDVEALCFNYGQRHDIEIIQAHKIAKKHSVKLTTLDARVFQELADSALVKTGSSQSVNEKHSHKKGLPASFVPGRNALFLTIAHAYAQKVGANYIYAGMCQTDYSGYPDCREKFIYTLNQALNIGYEADVLIRTPLMHLTKAQTFELAYRNGVLNTVIELSHTCYNGNRELKHDWGYGCGECPACKLRAKGWKEYKQMVNDE